MAPKKNAFFYYMLHIKKYEEFKGRSFPGGLKDVAEVAGPTWRQLTESEKEPYERKAKQERERNERSNAAGGRFTSQGIPVTHVEQMEIEEAERKKEKQRIVKRIIDHGIETKTLEDIPFYIITFNYFVKDDNDQYYPAEMGVVRFSLNDGIMSKLHQFMNPGKLPSGFAYTAKSHADYTHKLPLPPNALGSSNLLQSLEQLTTFLNAIPTLSNSDNFYLLVLEDEEKLISNILIQLHEASDIDFDQYKLLPLTYFFYQLRETLGKNNEDDNITAFTEVTAKLFLAQDTYRFNTGNGCEFHEKDEVNPHCAVSRVTRNAFSILKETMDLANVEEKVPGCHFPIGMAAKKDPIKEEYKAKDEDDNHRKRKHNDNNYDREDRTKRRHRDRSPSRSSDKHRDY